MNAWVYHMAIDFKKHLKTFKQFLPSQQFMVMDYETYSEADLLAVGAFEYSKHPTSDIICVSFATGTADEFRRNVYTVKSWVPELREEHYAEFFADLIDTSIIKVAHNAFFEQVMTLNVFCRRYASHFTDRIKAALKPSQWICTASLARACALPGSMEKAVDALSLPMKKNMDGRRLVLKWCKPKRPSKKDPSIRHTDPDELQKIVEYCEDDIHATIGLFLRLPELTATERKVWCLDQKINLHGFSVDLPLVDRILEMVSLEKENMAREVDEISMGILENTNSPAALLEYLSKFEDCHLPDIQAKTVLDTLESGMVAGNAERLLEIRRDSSKTSTAKYEALKLRSQSDGRSRDNLMYHTASTGRWGGLGFQPQNLPRGIPGLDTIHACEIIQTEDLDMIRLLYGNPMDVFSSCIRNMIIATPGKILQVADYNAIEARVAFWMAGDHKTIKAFVEGRDLYKEQAASVFNLPVDEIGSDSVERFVGKGLVLGCQFQMSGPKFKLTCKTQGVDIDEDLAIKAVAVYRADHQPVVAMWKNMNESAIGAVLNPGQAYMVNKVKWIMEDQFLFCVLPSGRRLSYPFPEVHYEDKFKSGRKMATLKFMGINSTTKQWEQQDTYGGKLTENVVQGVARDVMAEAMVRIDEDARFEILLSIHDELVSESDTKKKLSNDEFCRLMEVLPLWAEGLPLKAKGYTSYRFRK